MIEHDFYTKAMRIEAETIRRAQEAKTPQQKEEFIKWATEAQNEFVWCMRMAGKYE